MRKCPDCGSISTDDKQTCGVCGTSLEGSASLSLEQAEQIHGPEFHPKAQSRKSGLVVILAGPTLLIIGIIVLFFNGPFSIVGVVPLLIGMFATAIGNRHHFPVIL